MKIPTKVRRCILITIIGISCWALGFIQGNASGSRRVAIAEFIMHSATLQSFERGDMNKARVFSTKFVQMNDRYLSRDQFWWTALKEAFRVGNNELSFEQELPRARNSVNWASNAPKIHLAVEASPNTDEER